MKSSNTKLDNVAKRIYKKYKNELDDVILYGSYMKGKENYNDIDLLLIFKDKVDKKIEDEFKKELKELNSDINSVTLTELEGENFVAKEGIYLEGKSLLSGKLLGETLGFSSLAFVKYDTRKIKGSNRIKFYYALQGRGNSNGFLVEIGAKRYSDNVIVCDYLIIEKVKPFFEHWNIEYQITPALVPKRLRHLLLFRTGEG